MRVLGIETSCDETGVAVYDSEHGLLGHALHSQAAMHAQHGGVVPELASRDHVRKLVPLIRHLLAPLPGTLAFADTSSKRRQERWHYGIDAVAYTQGPGLIGALLVGAAVGRSLAWAWEVPAIGVHHMEAHLLAPLLEPQPPSFPFIALLVSGGHTQLLRADGLGRYTMLGESVDDAAGEAFDKTAKLLGLGYPGGPALAALATQGRAGVYQFPRPMTNRPGLDFSFSGLKTFALHTFQASAQTAQDKADIALAFEQAVAETLKLKCRRALQQTGLRQLVVAGGVSANHRLRQALSDLPARVYYPQLQFCTDNGAMVALAGCLRLQHAANPTDGAGSLAFGARPRWPLAELALRA